MRVPQCQKCQTTPPATRTGRRGQPAGQTTGDGQQATGSGRRAGGSIALKGRFHVHTNSDYRAPELWHSNGLRQRESGNDPEPAPQIGRAHV